MNCVPACSNVLFSDWEAEDTEQDTLEFELKIKCTWDRDENKDASSRADDMYKNNNGKLYQ